MVPRLPISEGKITYFTYNKAENAWYMQSEGQEKKLIEFQKNGSVKAFLKDGLAINVTVDAMGVDQLRNAQAGTSYFMVTR